MHVTLENAGGGPQHITITSQFGRSAKTAHFSLFTAYPPFSFHAYTPTSAYVILDTQFENMPIIIIIVIIITIEL